MKPIAILLLITLFSFSCSNREKASANSDSNKSQNILIDHLFNANAAYTIGFLQGNSFATNDVGVYIGFEDQTLLGNKQVTWDIEQMAKGAFKGDDESAHRIYYFSNETESLIGEILNLNLFNGSDTLYSAPTGFTIPGPTNLQLIINDSVVYEANRPERRIHYRPLSDRIKISWQKSELTNDRLFIIIEAPTTDKTAGLPNSNCFEGLKNVKDVHLNCDLCPDPGIIENIQVYENYRVIELVDELEEYSIPNCLFDGLEKRNIWFNLRRVNFEEEEVNSEKYFMYNISQDHLILESN